MSVLPIQAWQYIAWGLGLIEVIVGLYILALNIWNNANRHVGVWLLFTSASTIATGLLFSADTTAQMLSAFTIQVMVAPVAQVGLFIITAVLLAPQLMQGRRRWWWVPVYIVAFLPMLLTIVDTQLGTRLWFTPVPEGVVIGIRSAASDFENGTIAVPLRILNSALPSIGIVLALLIALRKDTPAMTRRLAWLLFAGLVIVTGSQFGLRSVLTPNGANLLTSFAFAILYTYIGFRQMVSERRLQRGRLRLRLTWLVLVVAIPLIVAAALLMNNLAAEGLSRLADDRLTLTAESLQAERQSIQQTLGIVSLSIILGGGLLSAVLVSLAISQAIQPVNSLMQTAAAVTAGDLSRETPVESEDEFGAMARSFNSMTEQLRGLIGSLEARVAERTADLNRRSEYLAASAEVARAASSILDSERLVQEAVELIRERFDLYYVGLFLVDEQRQWAVLQAGTGQAGRAMLTRGHRLAVDNNSMIGWSIVNAQARIAMQAETDTVRRTTAELPETRSEAALPLRSRGQVLGALTVQSTQPDIFDQDIITVLQTMADQIGIALENARLLAESQAAVEASRRASGELSREGWRQLIRTQAMTGVRSVESGVTVVPDMETEDVWPAEARHALRTGQTVHATDPGDPVPMAVPVQVRGNVIGVIDTYKPSGSQWTPEEITLAETLAEQLGIALESARLYQDTRERAVRERLVGEVTSRIRETLDMETVLRTATGEIRQALNLGDLVIRLLPPKADDRGKRGTQ
jgi:GAF domain-containing protein/HAMP domain-containing protein